MRDAMTLDEGPHPGGVGEVRCAVVQDDGRAKHEPARDEPGSHHPADVGRPQDHVALLKIEAVREVLRRLDWEPTVHVLRAFRLAGRARGVDHHEQVLGGRVGDVQHRTGVGDAGPGNVAAALGIRAPDAVDDDDGVDGRRSVRGAVGGLFHRDDLTPPIETVRADEHLRLGVA